MNGKIQEVTNFIREMVESAGQLTGSRLSLALRDRFPDWSPTAVGVRNLREFISTYAPDVIIAGRAGMDVAYALKGSASNISASPPTVSDEVDLWRVWVSPNSPLALAIERNGEAVTTVPRRSEAPISQVIMESPSVEVHREVAAEFLQNIPSPLQSRLRSILDSQTTDWWQVWLRELQGSEYLSAWNNFRRQQFEERLATQLHDVGLEKDAVASVLQRIRRQHAIASLASRNTAPPYSAGKGHELRRLTAEVIQRMSDSELRELRLPLGIVLDVLETLRTR